MNVKKVGALFERLGRGFDLSDSRILKFDERGLRYSECLKIPVSEKGKKPLMCETAYLKDHDEAPIQVDGLWEGKCYDRRLLYNGEANSLGL